ncbi:MAG: endonuclease/exonuclease/phosphatase family protein [Chthoniobacteraceae bacterium]
MKSRIWFQGLPITFHSQLALTAVLFLLFARLAGAQTSFSVLQTNIHRDIGGSDSVTSAQPYLAQEVNYFNPDIWTINELGGNNTSFNLTTATNYLVSFIQNNITAFGSNPVLGTNYFIYVSTINDGYDTSAIVSRYPITASQTFSDAGGGNSALRGLIEATVSIGGKAVDVFGTHLKASSTTSDAQQRQSQADTDSATIAAWIAAHPSDAVIATGDWNETVETSESDNWSSGSLNGTITLKNGTKETYNPVSTMKSAGLIDPRPTTASGSVDTISSSNPDARFDYILYAQQNLQYVSGEVFNSAEGMGLASTTSANASDHLPVFETFMLVPEPSVAGLAFCGALFFLRRQPARG